MSKPQTSDAPTMTLAMLKAGHADVYGEAFKLGAEAERGRVAWILKHGASVTAELRQKAVDEGWDSTQCAEAFLSAINTTKDERLAALQAEGKGEDAKLSNLRTGQDTGDTHKEGDYADPSKLKGATNKAAELAAVEAMPLGEERFKKEWELSAKSDPEWAGLAEGAYLAIRKAEMKEGN